MGTDLVDAVLSSSMDAIMVLRSIRSESGIVTDFECTMANASAADITGAPVDGLIGRRFSTISPVSSEVELIVHYARIAESGGRYAHEWCVDNDDDHDGVRWFASSATGLAEPVCGVVVAFRETTEHRRSTGILSELQVRHEILERQALRDPLTGLANRLLLDSHLEHAVKRLQRHEASVAVLFLDLDGLKAVNDSHGHAAGDALLVELAKRFQSITRSYDTVSRIGGDEFVVVCDDLTSDVDMLRIAHRYLDVCAEPVMVDALHLKVTVSIGIAIADSGHETVGDLIASADRAMYRAKAQGGGRVEFADEDAGRRSAWRFAAERRLATALADDDLELRFEPIVRASDRSVAAAELSLHWPGASSGDTEQSSVGDRTVADLLDDPTTARSLVIDAGYHALRVAIAQVSRWTTTFCDRRIVALVNASPSLLEDTGFVDRLLAMLDEHSVDSGRLSLGITEEFLMAEPADGVIDVLDRLDAAGVVLQRCGLGPRSTPTQYTQRFAIRYVELHPTLIATLGTVGHDIISAVHDLSRSRGATVVSPAVSNQQQFDALVGLGTELFRGPFISPPLALADFEAFVESCATD